MGRIVKGLFSRRELTPLQYSRANKAMAYAMLVIMLVFLIVEIGSPECAGCFIPPAARHGTYIATIIISAVITQKKIRTKIPSIVNAVAFAWCFAVLVFTHGATTMMLVFPAMLTMVVYMNGRLIMLGGLVTIIITFIKIAMINTFGDAGREVQTCSLVFLGVIICMICGCNAIRLIIDFQKEAYDVILKKTAEQTEVAETVSDQVGTLDSDFHSVVDTVTAFTYTLDNAISAIQNIADSTDNTAEAVDKQATLTSEIQDRLENTNTNVENALGVTENLKEAIVNGRAQSDELGRQSVLVDENTAQISTIVDQLVENVAKVSSITESILGISSQTNLLALNASIEAARAGEAGKGFAVVADEIRGLAEETKNATEMITAIISELNGVTDETQKGIEQSIESINMQRQKVQEVNESFGQIEDGMNQMSLEMNTVAKEVAAVLEANQTIVDSITTLMATSQEVTASASSGREQMQALGDNMKGLSGLIEGAFKKLQVLREAAVIKEELEL